jgi:hypothetical protein
MRAYILQQEPGEPWDGNTRIVVKVGTVTARDNVAAVLTLFLRQGKDVTFFTDKSRSPWATGPAYRREW